MEMFALHGKWNCMYLYFRRVLEWNIGTFSRYTSILGSFGLIAQYVLVPILSSKLKLHDSTIALLGTFIRYVLYHLLHIKDKAAKEWKSFEFLFSDSLTSVINYLIIAFAVNEWMLYIGGTIAILDATSTTFYRSMISKNVEADEVGKVFSIVATFQALLPFMSGPAFNYLYKFTVKNIPSAWVFLVIGIRSFNFFVLLIVNIGMRKEQERKSRLGQLKNKDDKEDTSKELIS